MEDSVPAALVGAGRQSELRLVKTCLINIFHAPMLSSRTRNVDPKFIWAGAERDVPPTLPRAASAPAQLERFTRIRKY